MVHYVGLDVSLKLTSICIVSETGSVVREGKVDSDPEAIAAFVKSKASDVIRIGLETDRRLPGYGQNSSDLACR